jgi:hypothetical protein
MIWIEQEVSFDNLEHLNQEITCPRCDELHFRPFSSNSRRILVCCACGFCCEAGGGVIELPVDFDGCGGQAAHTLT